jgi:hypothetical protein
VHLDAASSSEESLHETPARGKKIIAKAESFLERADVPIPPDDATARADDILPSKPIAKTLKGDDDDSFVLPEKLRNPPPPR